MWLFNVIWYIFPVLVCCTKKNLATLMGGIFSQLKLGQLRFPGRVARWFSFKPKIPIWVNFGGP
jgi:hypothetical protein